MAKNEVWVVTGASRGIGLAIAKRVAATGDSVALLARGDSVHALAHELGRNALGVQVDIIKLYGSMELAPLVGLADRIVDVVDTGNTLKANGLKPMELIAYISSRLVVNQASMKMKHTAMQSLIDHLASAVEQAKLEA